MTVEYAVCPHCGCRCEDDEYCAACGKLFHEDVATRNISLLGLLGSGLWFLSRNFSSNLQDNGNIDFSLDQDSDLDFDASWSSLSSNLYNRHNLK